jgi:pyrimidine-nucleoside phosphorylase
MSEAAKSEAANRILPARLIARKRDGATLTPEEWREVVAGYTDGRIPDYQMSSLLMATWFRGLEPGELEALTEAMLTSGARLTIGPGGPPRVDKHSTGGVGDKVSLALGPLVAACGAAVPMISGRGLGHTGGTLDKLEAIPGFRTRLSLDEARRQVDRIGCVMLGQTADLVPADRKLYALRDATGTVEAIPLIAASIMSKKLAEGLDALVLDVKHGAGAFLPEWERGIALARTMITLGAAHGCRTVALLTAMDRPLGHACGNALETEEAFLLLRGEGPPDLREITLALGAEMLVSAGVAADRNAARRRLEAALASGDAAARARAVVEAQGGNPAVVDDPATLPQAPRQEVWEAPADGFVARVEPRTLGWAIVEMGGGRRVMEDEVDPAVGFVITAKPGDRVRRGQPLATIHGRDERTVLAGRRALHEAVRVEESPPADVLPLVGWRVTEGGVEEVRTGGRENVRT